MELALIEEQNETLKTQLGQLIQNLSFLGRIDRKLAGKEQSFSNHESQFLISLVDDLAERTVKKVEQRNSQE